MNIHYELKAVYAEYIRASMIFPLFHSAHEGLAIIREEYKELEKEVFMSKSLRSRARMRKEAKHLAAMALRFLVDVVEED